jgi:hypothetical protein
MSIAPAYQSLDAVNNSASYSSLTPIDALTNVIGQYMTSNVSQTSNTRKKRMIEREYGESLTNMDVLVRLQEKEKAKRRKTTKPAKKKVVDSVGTKKRCVFKTFSSASPL